MENFILILFFFSFIGLVIGLLEPSAVIKWGNERMRTRKMVIVIFGSMITIFFSLLVLLEFFAPESKVACSFTREPEETWLDEKAADPPIGGVKLVKNFHLKTYDVFGSDIYEVNDSVNKEGPIFTKTFEGVAAVSTVVSGSWDKESTPAGCTLTGATVVIDMILELPNWVNKTVAADQDQKMWDLHFEFIKRHEQGHLNITLKAARELQAELARPRSAPTCEKLDDVVNKLFAATDQRKVEADAEYDNRTNNKTQEPNFPYTCNWSEIKL